MFVKSHKCTFVPESLSMIVDLQSFLENVSLLYSFYRFYQFVTVDILSLETSSKDILCHNVQFNLYLCSRCSAACIWEVEMHEDKR